MLIKKYFSKKESSMLLTSNFFSSLYYNCDVWLIPSLRPQLKQHMLSASARALFIVTPNYNNVMYFDLVSRNEDCKNVKIVIGSSNICSIDHFLKNVVYNHSFPQQ